MQAEKKSEYRHGEAFCLMWYACQCGHRERIWNSRDGVTPFGLACPSCGGTSLQHVDWRADERKPDHVLARGQRYFYDGTTHEAEKFIERRIEKFAEAGHPIPPDIIKKLRYDAKAGVGEWLPGWPAVGRKDA